MKHNRIVVFTHNDLDALGSMLNIEYKLPNVEKKYFHTNYANIPQIVDQIFAHLSVFDVDFILIPDVSFATDKESLTRLYESGQKIIHIDHHLYPDGFWDDYPDMTVVWDKTKSATKLCNEYFGNTGKNANLDKLTSIIDVYDLWKIDSSYFGVAQDFNNYFWEVGIEWLCNEIVSRDFKLPENFKDIVDNFNWRCKNTIQYYEDSKKIMRSGPVTFSLTNEFFNQINLKEMENGQQVVVGINDYGIVRCRLNQKSIFTDEQIDDIRFKISGEKETGHKHAFTFKIDIKTPSDAFAEVQRIAKILGEYL
jgi:oligoribonuclease NrnB/cAMP/cGMP phosphodiesterase (DHH superfamily)